VSATTRSSTNNKIKESKDNTTKNTKPIGILKQKAPIINPVYIKVARASDFFRE
jgi:PHD/YefM family antitoxin component YafN of YafNO toxin-antitoxin module